MGLWDRDYMHREKGEGGLWPRRPMLWILGSLVLCLLIVGWLLRTRDRDSSSPPQSEIAPSAPPPAVSPEPPSQPVSSPRRVARLVNVNTATFQQLDALPYISPNTAKAIIEGRPYDSPDDLLRVPG